MSGSATHFGGKPLKRARIHEVEVLIRDSERSKGT